MRKKLIAIIFAVLAAALYALNMPFSKLLLNNISPTMLAAFLYLGAGLGIGILFLFKLRSTKREELLGKHDFIYTLGMILLDILAPILLMLGLKDTGAMEASLLNNFEIVATSLIALIIFKEAISIRMWIAIVLITIASFFLSIEDLESFRFSWGSILVLLATACWGLENNCTRSISNKSTYEIVFLKGIFSGLGSLIVAFCIGESLPRLEYIMYAMGLGLLAYGLSIFFYIKAQSELGAAKTSAYYSVAPFIGVLLAYVIFKDRPGVGYYIGLAIMLVATIIIVIDTLKKQHEHMHTHEISYEENGIKKTKIITHSHPHEHILNEAVHHHHHYHL